MQQDNVAVAHLAEVGDQLEDQHKGYLFFKQRRVKVSRSPHTVRMLARLAFIVAVLALVCLVEGLVPQRYGSLIGRVSVERHLATTPPEDEDRPANPPRRRIIGRDNLGEPIYEGEDRNQGEKLDILGLKLNVDPLSASLLIFLVIAFQFFVLANL